MLLAYTTSFKDIESIKKYLSITYEKYTVVASLEDLSNELMFDILDLIVFDDQGDITLIDTLRVMETQIKSLKVIASSIEIGNMYTVLTEDIQIKPSPLNIMMYLWDNPAFSLGNMITANENGISVFNTKLKPVGFGDSYIAIKTSIDATSEVDLISIEFNNLYDYKIKEDLSENYSEEQSEEQSIEQSTNNEYSNEQSTEESLSEVNYDSLSDEELDADQAKEKQFVSKLKNKVNNIKEQTDLFVESFKSGIGPQQSNAGVFVVPDGTDGEPTIEPTVEPQEQSTVELREQSTVEPTIEPTIEPTVEPQEQFVTEPIVESTIEPQEQFTVEPTIEPQEQFVTEPTIEPTIEPTVEPTVEPITEPSKSTVKPTTEQLISDLDKLLDKPYKTTTQPLINPYNNPNYFRPTLSVNPVINPQQEQSETTTESLSEVGEQLSLSKEMPQITVEPSLSESTTVQSETTESSLSETATHEDSKQKKTKKSGGFNPFKFLNKKSKAEKSTPEPEEELPALPTLRKRKLTIYKKEIDYFRDKCSNVEAVEEVYSRYMTKINSGELVVFSEMLLKENVITEDEYIKFTREFLKRDIVSLDELKDLRVVYADYSLDNFKSLRFVELEPKFSTAKLFAVSVKSTNIINTLNSRYENCRIVMVLDNHLTSRLELEEK